MKRKTMTHMARLLCVLTLALTMTTAAFADDPPEPTQATPCHPTAVTRSEDGSEIRKMHDLGPENNPAGIPRSDFEQNGFHYTLTDLLKQELPANESRQHTETVSVSSPSKDMGTVLALLPQTKEFITEDGTTYEIDRVKYVCRAASTEVGGIGLRYTVMICGNETFLFDEENGNRQKHKTSGFPKVLCFFTPF